MSEPDLRGPLFEMESWEVMGVTHGATFFRLLHTTLPYATTLYLEGSNIPAAVRHTYTLAIETELVTIETELLTMSTPEYDNAPCQLRIRFKPAVLETLAEISESLGDGEICDNLYVHHYGEPLLEWYDVLVSPIHFSLKVPESRVRRFCKLAGGTYRYRAAAD